MMIRTGDGAVASVVSSTFHGIFNRLTNLIYELRPQNMEYALRGSNVRNTAPWTNNAFYGGGTAFDTDLRAKTLSFVGRDLLGHKSRFFVYGYKGSANGDYRVQIGENADVASVVTYLDAATGAFLSVGGGQPVWKGYANVDFNDHWIKRARLG